MSGDIQPLIEAGAKALVATPWDLHAPFAAAVVIEAVQPLIVEGAFATLLEQIRALQHEAYIDWRSAVPGDVASAAEAGGRSVAFSKVIELLEGSRDVGR